MEPISIEFKIAEVTQVLQDASKLGGAVFGGYLRDVIIPRMMDLTAVVEWKDVDIWFKEKDQADQFVAWMGERLRRDHPGYKEDAGGVYEFIRIQYSLIHQDQVLTFMDVIVAETLPVNDFDVNQIAFSCVDGIFHQQAGRTLEILAPQIKAKKATLLPSYVMLLLGLGPSNQEWKTYCHWYRLGFRYLERGWTIYTPDGVPLNLNPFVKRLLEDESPPSPSTILINELKRHLGAPQEAARRNLDSEPSPDSLMRIGNELSRQIEAISDKGERNDVTKRIIAQLMKLLLKKNERHLLFLKI